MKKGILAALVCITLFTSCEKDEDSPTTVSLTVDIPDAAFEQALMDLGLDDELDGSLLKANVKDVWRLDIFSQNITDLTGIEAFEELGALFCYDNQLVTLDVSSNINLEFLNCSRNNINALKLPPASQVFKELEFSYNNLTTFEMKDFEDVNWVIGLENALTSVDISGSKFNAIVAFDDNAITEINLEGTEIEKLSMRRNNISFLDISEKDMQWFYAEGNPNLTCVKVNEEQMGLINSNTNSTNWTIDATTSFTLDCSE